MKIYREVTLFGAAHSYNKLNYKILIGAKENEIGKVIIHNMRVVSY